MAITSASIEANGWVLKLRFTGTPGSFASYALDPDGTPKVVLTTTHPGFVQSAGIAVAGSMTRTIVATKPVRKPAAIGVAFTPVIDETDNGDGTVTCRLALSAYVHATETSLSLSVAAGWRSGEAAGSNIPVTNGSTFAAALPIFRWADHSYLRVTGSATLELVVFSHHPVGLQPVAGVRFTLTDGTTVKTAWATALSTSTKYGDSLRVYSVTIDPAAATALTAGLLRADAEVYPWLGAMRSTDPAGTRSMTALDTAGYGDSAQSPFVIGYDPAGTRYAGQVVYVDPVNGTTTAAAGMVQSTVALAKAVTAASRARDVGTAAQALYLANRTLAAANGQSGRNRSTDGARIILAVGTHAGLGTTAVTAGITDAELPLQVEGDPDDANPRGNCILQTATALNIRVSKLALANLALELGGASLTGTATVYWRLDNIEVRGKTGSEAATVALVTPSAPSGSYNFSATRTKWWKYGLGMRGATNRYNLVRACEASRQVEALCVLGHRFIGGGSGYEDSFQTGQETAVGGWTGAATLGGAEDNIFAGCDLRYLKGTGQALRPVALAAATAGTPNPSVRRFAFVNNVCEKIGAGGSNPFYATGENGSVTASYNLIEGCSFVGERCNTFYGDPLPATLAETSSQVNQHFGNRIANTYFDWMPTKHDAFDDDTTNILRGFAAGGTHGFRPQMIEGWSALYGVGWEGNVDLGRHASAGNFVTEYIGRRGVQVVGGNPLFTLDRSTLSGGTTTGGGDYKPLAAAAVIGRGQRASVDRDRTGEMRTVPFASGAIDTPSAAVSVAAASGTHASRSTSPAVSWTGVLTPAGSLLATIAGAPVVGFAAALGPAGGMHALGSGSPGVTTTGLTLLPDGAVATMTDIGAAVLPDLLFATPRLVRIEGEVRVQLINPG